MSGTPATGGKVWSIPKTQESQPNSSFKNIIEEFISTLGFVYAILLVASFATMVVLLIVNTLKNVFISPSIHLDPHQGYLKVKEADFAITPTSILLVILIPLVITFALIWIINKTSIFNNDHIFDIFMIVIFIIFFITAIFIFNDLNVHIGFNSNTAIAKEWMHERYGFNPINLSNVQDAMKGHFMYSSDPAFPAHDVYMKENNGAYFLYDSSGKELLVK